ncbi:protein-export chaperone SecB [Pedomonas mirosovicensis]|uniref:protein-export chaperone SecB n=1 Tax=Pedomonas mirosovicensis TaxID=2908641 RepID=UPI002168A8D5|nr:protein-export chaperone SecB [Pedomonas mirosovicensis]MCH8684022.1 protein-export chaperone SecB [Pedomonas mirosovicensis]
MSEQPEDTTEVAAGEDTTPQVGILAQYVKDLSFENPNAPQSLQNAGAQPRIEVNVNVGVRRVADEAYEVDLRIEAIARHEAQKAFQVELMYSGLFALKNVPEEALEPFLLVEAPRMLFPFARRIIADCTRDGGFPPLLLDPIDFAALFVQQRQANGGADLSGEVAGNA